MLDLLLIAGVILLSFIVASFPLYLSVKMLGGRTSLLRAVGVNLVVGIVTSLLYIFFSPIAIVVFLVAVVLYREMFRLRWWKAFLVWFIQIFLSVLLALLLSVLIGMSLLL